MRLGAVDRADVDRVTRGLLDLGDLFEREPFLGGGPDDGVGLFWIQVPIRPAHGGEREVHVPSQSSFTHSSSLPIALRDLTS